MSTFAFTQSVASCASLKSVRGKSAPKARRGAMQVRAANLMDTCRSSGLTQFADAVEKAGLTGEINGGSFTVFAPSNDAMSAFTNPDGTHSTADILKYHCIKGKIASKHSKFYLRDDTALGDFFTSHSIQPCILSMTTCRHPAYTHPALSASRDHSVLTNLSSIQTLPVPLLLGFSTGPLFYLSKQVWHIDLAPWQFFFASTVTFGAALAGITYGVLSASWEPGRDGTFWGVTEVKANIPILWQTILGKAAGEIETKWDDEWDDGK